MPSSSKAPRAKPTAQASSSTVKRAKKISAGSLSIPGRSRKKTFKASRRRQQKGSSTIGLARFSVGDVVRHKFYPFRGVIFDIDPVFANTEEWWLSIPENMRPRKNQPFYHLLAENAETEYIAYVSEQNLLPDDTGLPLRHPQVAEYFTEDDEGRYRAVFMNQLN